MGVGAQLAAVGFRPSYVRDPDDVVMGTFSFGFVITDNATTTSNLLAALTSFAGIADPVLRALFGSGANPQVILHFEELAYCINPSNETQETLRQVQLTLQEVHTPQGGTTADYYNCHEHWSQNLSAVASGATTEATLAIPSHIETYPIKEHSQIIDAAVDTDVIGPHTAINSGANIPGMKIARGAIFRRPGTFNRGEYMADWKKYQRANPVSARTPAGKQSLLLNFTQRDRAMRGKQPV